MSLFDIFRGTAGKRAPQLQAEGEQFPEILPQIPEGAVKLGHDTKKEFLQNHIYAQTIERMNQNLVPILVALGMLTKENLHKFGQMDGTALVNALRENFTDGGGSPFFFDELRKNVEFRNKFTGSCTLPPHVWPYITIEKCDSEQKEWYPSDYIAVLNTDKLKPFYDVWLSGKALEKRKQHLRLIEELNQFFESGTSRQMMEKYFLGGLATGNKITPDDAAVMNGPFTYLDTTKPQKDE